MWHGSGDAAASLGSPSRGFRLPGETLLVAPTAATLSFAIDAHNVSFVPATEQFNTTTSMWRLTLNVLLSFAQFEREVTSERIRDKIAASKRKGLWVGGMAPLGYDKRIARYPSMRLRLHRSGASSPAISGSAASTC